MVRPLLFLGLLALGACNSSTDNAPGGVGGNAPSDDGSAAAPSDGGSGIAQSVECKQLLACLTAIDPTYAAPLVARYGPGGSCWSDAATATTCTHACVATLADYGKTSSAPECHPAWPDMAMRAPADMAMAPADLATPPSCRDQNAACTSPSQCCSNYCVTGVCL